jgi:hypothetical protein
MNPDGGPSQREKKQLVEMTSFGPGDLRVAEAVGNRHADQLSSCYKVVAARGGFLK